ncbi:acyltransferase [Halalkalibacter nanhaiisediminis]|uniref:Membrane-bound acyltransferase YfiQ involved in biofilm formation n=1 Tax=Halalkalibacter nanhaiisediminis TaxID=688079 RepID=A0A562QST4_9BACI|nr:acyltransferase [Halalkalibacter nanhaiisediminis]TWI59819.1 membrane-bound acyltransferase YfiQ involved in biofilm formation [Halalkalibacter nanhaiisediminis]
MSKQAKKQLQEIVIIRAIAILAVLMVHSTSVTIIELVPDSNAFVFFNAINTFFRFGTPTFILLSSLVLFYSYYHKPLSRQLIHKFYSNRLLYILLPYLIFSFIYNGIRTEYFQTYESFQEFISTFTEELLLGNAYTHLYFVFISIQFFLLFPLLLVVLKKWPALTKHLIWIGFVIQWTFVFYNCFVWQYPDTGSISLSYMSYYLTGAFIGIYYADIKAWIKTRQWLVAGLFVAWLAAVIGHISIWHSTRVLGNAFHSLLYTFMWNAHTILTALLLIYLSVVIVKKAPAWITGSLMKLGYLSFGIYLIHPLYLFYFREYVDPGGNMTLYYLFIAGSFFGALLISGLIVYLILYKFKWGWVFFGARPRINKREINKNNAPAP